jgi:hypothetical protein
MPNRPPTQLEPQPNKREPQRSIAGIFGKRPPIAAPMLANDKRVAGGGQNAGDDSWADGKSLSEIENFAGQPHVPYAQIIDYGVRKAFLEHQAHMQKIADLNKSRVTWSTFDAGAGYVQRPFPWPYPNDLGEASIENYSNVAFNVYVGEVVSGIPYTVVPASASVGGSIIKWFPIRENVKYLTLVPISVAGTVASGQVTVWFANVARTPGVATTPPTQTAVQVAQGTTQPTTVALVAAGTTTQTIKATGGRVFLVNVLVGGTAAFQLNDGANIIFASPTTTTPGQQFPLNLPFVTNLVFNSSALGPGVSITYS